MGSCWESTWESTMLTLKTGLELLLYFDFAISLDRVIVPPTWCVVVKFGRPNSGAAVGMPVFVSESASRFVIFSPARWVLSLYF